MLVSALAENTCCFEDYEPDNGLSLFITTPNHKLLFDFGNTGVFLNNARKMGIDVSTADTAVLSHSHFDHANGIAEFLRANKKARVYMQRSAFDGIYGAQPGETPQYAGVDPSLEGEPRITLLDGSAALDGELELFSAIRPGGVTTNLFRKQDGTLIPDDFRHEQCLIVREEGKTKLVTGCSHCGIGEIFDQATARYGRIDVLLGGFHAVKYNFDDPAAVEELMSLGRRLRDSGVMCYTCHCTTQRGYSILKRAMGERLGYISTGCTLNV